MIEIEDDDLPTGGGSAWTAMATAIATDWRERVRYEVKRRDASLMRDAFKDRPSCKSCKTGKVVLSHHAEDGTPRFESHCSPCLEHIEAWERWACSVGGIRHAMLLCDIPLAKGVAA